MNATTASPHAYIGWRHGRLLAGLVSILIVATACSGTSQPGVPIDPSQLPGGLPHYAMTGERGFPAAAIPGTLIEEDGCVYVASLYEQTYLVLWPSGWTFDRQSAPARVIGPDGEVVAFIGDEVRFGGGIVPRSVAEENSADALPTCSPQTGYWLFSGEVLPVQG
jgi:hypothetical protein